MSVTFHIYKLVRNVEYIGIWYDQFTFKEIKQAMAENNKFVLEGPKKEAENEAFCWSDKKVHDIFNLYDYQPGLDKRLEKRMMKKIDRVNLPFQIGLRNRSYPYKIIPVEEIAYSQGWFVRRRFLNKKNSLYIAVTKEEMMKFFRKYGTIPKKDSVNDYVCGGYAVKHTNDLRLIDTMNQFEKVFEPGCIFVASY